MRSSLPSLRPPLPHRLHHVKALKLTNVIFGALDAAAADAVKKDGGGVPTFSMPPCKVTDWWPMPDQGIE